MSGQVYPLVGHQRDAVDPRESVWLSASAGTGKTQVLSARVLRLLLEPGADPSQIIDARARQQRRSRRILARQAIMLIDKQTGDLLGDPIFPQLNGERLTGEMAVLPGVLLLQTSKGIVTLRTTPRGGRGAKELN